MRKLSFFAAAFTLFSVCVSAAPARAEDLTQLEAAITILKEVDRTTAAPGDVITYRLTVVNTGNGPASNVVVTDAVPANTTYVPGSTTIATGVTSLATGPAVPVSDPSPGVSPLAMGLNIDGLRGFPTSGFFKVVTFQVRINPRVASGTIIRDVATVVSDQTGQITSNEVQTRIISRVSLTITISANPSSAGPNVPITFTIQVTNTGNDAATNVVVRDVLPASLSFVAGSITVNGVPRTDAGNPLTSAGGLNIDGLAAGATSTVTFRAVIVDCPVKGSTIANSASAESDQTAAVTATVLVTVLEDTTGPSITIVAPAEAQTFTHCDVLPLTFIVTSGCVPINPASIQVLIDNTVVASNVTIGPGGVVNIVIADLTPFTVGGHIITIVAANTSGVVTRAFRTFAIVCSPSCALEILRRGEAAGAFSAQGARLLRIKLLAAQGTAKVTACAELRCALCLLVAEGKANRPGAAAFSASLADEIRCLLAQLGCPPGKTGF